MPPESEPEQKPVARDTIPCLPPDEEDTIPAPRDDGEEYVDYQDMIDTEVIMTSDGKRRGFAAMDPEARSELASKGGKAAHAQGTAHEFTPDEAREAGRKGGLASHRRRRELEAAVTRGETESTASTVKRGA